MPIQIPTIDISAGIDDPGVIRQLQTACEEWGFFQVLGHGVDQGVRRELFQAMDHFFQLPLQVKQQVARSESNYWGFFDKELTKNVQDWKQIYDIDANLANQNDRQNPMPVPWSPQSTELKSVTQLWIQACESLSHKLLQALCLAMGQEKNTLDADFSSGHSSFLRLNYYPVCPNPDPGNSDKVESRLGINRHTDAGALTVLAQDEVPALQVRKKDTWHTVLPEPDAFIVNVGDMIQVWSNDKFKAAEHRVIASSKRTRYSAPYFYNPCYQSIIAPLAADSEPAKYRPISWAEFRGGRAAGDYADKGEEIQISWYLTGL